MNHFVIDEDNQIDSPLFSVDEKAPKDRAIYNHDLRKNSNN